MATRWRSKASSSCTIPSIEKESNKGTQRRPLSHVTKIDKNQCRLTLSTRRNAVATSAVAVGTGRIAHHIPDTSSITSFVFKNHGVHGGLYPAAITSAPLRRDAVSLQRPAKPLAALGDCRLAQVPAERVHREGPRGDVPDGDVGVRGLGGVRRLREATGGHEEGHLVRRGLGGVLLRSLGRADGSIRAVAGPARHEHRRGHGYRGRGIVLGLRHDPDVLGQAHERPALVALEHPSARAVRRLRDDRGGVSANLVESARRLFDDIVPGKLLRDLPEDGTHDGRTRAAASRVRARESATFHFSLFPTRHVQSAYPLRVSKSASSHPRRATPRRWIRNDTLDMNAAALTASRVAGTSAIRAPPRRRAAAVRAPRSSSPPGDERDAMRTNRGWNRATRESPRRFPRAAPSRSRPSPPRSSRPSSPPIPRARRHRVHRVQQQQLVPRARGQALRPIPVGGEIRGPARGHRRDAPARPDRRRRVGRVHQRVPGQEDRVHARDGRAVRVQARRRRGHPGV